MSFERFSRPDEQTPQRRRRNELIGRGVMVLAGGLILFGAWKLWDTAIWASEQDAIWNAKFPQSSHHRRPINGAFLLYLATWVVGFIGFVTCGMAFMSIRLMDRLFKPKPPITHDDGTGDSFHVGGVRKF